MDLAGPMQTQSIQGNYYHYILVDDCTRYKWAFFLRRKSDTFKCFKQFDTLVSTQFDSTLRAVRSDRGGEFLSAEFTQYMENKGIKHQLTTPHTPQQNGIAEQANRTVAEAARAMLQSVGMSIGFWECAVSTAIHVRNRAPSRATDYTSPHEHLHKEKLDISYLRVFGCLAYAHITSARMKFDPTSHKQVFMGYDGPTKGYKLWDPITHKLVVSTDVIFEESVFPLHTPKPPIQPSIPPSQPPQPPPEVIDLVLLDSDDEDYTHLTQPPSAQLPQPDVPTSTLPPDPNNASPDQRTQHAAPPWVPSVWTNTTDAYLAAAFITPAGDPTTYEYALSTPELDQWRKAMEEQMSSLQENGTWILVDLPEGRHPI